MKFVVFEMWGLERPTNVPKWIPSKSWCTKVLSSEGFAHGQGWRCPTAYVAWWGVLCKKMKFVVFEMWGLERPTNVPKWIPWNSWCTKVLSSEGLSLGQVGRCIVALPYGLGGVLCKNVVFEMWGLKRPTTIPKWIPWNSWCTKVLSSEGFAHG